MRELCLVGGDSYREFREGCDGTADVVVAFDDNNWARGNDLAAALDENGTVISDRGVALALDENSSAETKSGIAYAGGYKSDAACRTGGAAIAGSYALAIAYGGVAIALGPCSSACGQVGSYIILTEWRLPQNHLGTIHDEDYLLRDVKAFLVDGTIIKAGREYRLINGEAVICDD